MQKTLLAAAAISLFAIASAANAMDEKMYVSTVGGKQMVMGGTNAQGTEVIMGENGAKPANCPAGGFYTTDSSQQMVMACDDDTKFSLTAAESGMKMSDGNPYPEGSRLLNSEGQAIGSDTDQEDTSTSGSQSSGATGGDASTGNGAGGGEGSNN